MGLYTTIQYFFHWMSISVSKLACLLVIRQRLLYQVDSVVTVRQLTVPKSVFSTAVICRILQQVNQSATHSLTTTQPHEKESFHWRPLNSISLMFER